MDLNLNKEETQLQILDELEHIARATDGLMDAKYTALVAGANSKGEVDAIFASWWSKLWPTGEYTRTQLLERWFDLVADGNMYGVSFPAYSTSPSVDGTPLDATAELGWCTPSTNTVAGIDPYISKGAFWVAEVEYEIDADGEIDIKRVAGVDPDYTRAGAHGMVGVAQKNAWESYTRADGYNYYRYSTKPFVAAKPLPEGVKPSGSELRSFVVHAKYLGGLDENKIPTSATGLAAMIYNRSHNSQITEWRKRGANYAGMSTCDNAFRLHMFWLKYGKKGNSGTLEGCSTYNLSYAAVASEENVTRIILSTANAANLLVGSWCSVGNGGRNMNFPNGNVQIIGKEEVTIGETVYTAVSFRGTPITTTAGTTKLETLPWGSGSCDNVLGVDGSPTDCTNGKEPFIIQGLESMNGAYVILADVIHRQYKDGTNMMLEPAVCRMAAKLSTSITADYEAVDKPSNVGTLSGWQYIQDITPDLNHPEVLLPERVGGGAGSGNGLKAAVSLSGSAGVFGWLAWPALGCGGFCGLAGAVLSGALSGSYWYIGAGAPGSAANRGEWAA